MLERGSLPSSRTVPFDGLASPQSIRSIVDLPAPFGPSSAVIPGPMSKLTSETATTFPNHFETPRTSISASPVVLSLIGASTDGGS